MSIYKRNMKFTFTSLQGNGWQSNIRGITDSKGYAVKTGGTIFGEN
jgi:hypothetical protein